MSRRVKKLHKNVDTFFNSPKHVWTRITCGSQHTCRRAEPSSRKSLNLWYFQNFQNSQNLYFEKIFFKKRFFIFFLFFIKMMLIRFSLPSINPITLLYTVHPLSDTEPKIGKSWKVENPDLSRSAPPHKLDVAIC